MKLKSFYSLLITAGLTMAMLAGCGTTEEGTAGNTDKTEEQQAADSGGTVTITDAQGEVEIPASPRRIVDISGTSDILHILGYDVIGTANSDAYDYTTFPVYLNGILDGAEILGYYYQDTMDVEAVIALEPDLIVISRVQEKMYDQLQAVAPTVMIELAQMDWTEDLMNVAEIMNKTDVAEQWLEEYEVLAGEKGKEVKDAMGEDTTYAAFLASGGSLFVFSDTGVGSLMYDDMGLAKPAGMPEQENVSLPVITYEGLAEIDADYMIAIGTEEDLQALQANDIWNSLESVKAEQYIELPANVYFGIGYSSVGRKQFLDDAVELFESMK